jgi:hypothetical protein
MPFPVDNFSYINSIWLPRVRYLQSVRTDFSDAGAVTLATVTGSVEIERIIIKSTAVTTVNLTSVACTGGSADVVTFIDAISGARANIAAADQQVVWQGSVELGNAALIRLTFVGGGHTAVALLATIRYRAITSGAGLA